MIYPFLRVCLFCVQSFCLLIISFFPLKIRQSVLEASQSFFLPLIQKLLFPGSLRETQAEIQAPVVGNNPTHLVMLFCGNNETQEEIYQLFESYVLSHGDLLSRTSSYVISIPLWSQSSEEAYRKTFEDKLVSYLKNNHIQTQQVKTLEILGHSLGGGLALTCMKEIQKIFSHAEILVVLDRTFTKLSDAAHNLYGFLGEILERTLGLLWTLDNVKNILALQEESRIHISLYQVEPDHVLGEKGLLSVALRNQIWRVDWNIEHIHTHKQKAHALAFHEVFDQNKTTA